MGMWTDPSGQRKGSYENSSDQVENEGATPEVVDAHPQKTRRSPHKVGPSLRCTGEVLLKTRWKDDIKRDLAEVDRTAEDAFV